MCFIFLALLVSLPIKVSFHPPCFLIRSSSKVRCPSLTSSSCNGHATPLTESVHKGKYICISEGRINWLTKLNCFVYLIIVRAVFGIKRRRQRRKKENAERPQVNCLRFLVFATNMKNTISRQSASQTACWWAPVFKRHTDTL